MKNKYDDISYIKTVRTIYHEFEKLCLPNIEGGEKGSCTKGRT